MNMYTLVIFISAIRRSKISRSFSTLVAFSHALIALPGNVRRTVWCVVALHFLQENRNMY